MRLAQVLSFYVASLISAAQGASVIQSVTLEGTNLRVNLATQVGQPYDAASIDTDVRQLWSARRFEDVSVEAQEDADGIAVVFRVVEEAELRLHEIRIEPPSYGLHLSLPVGSILTRLGASRIAHEAERQLIDRGYLGAHVDWNLRPYRRNQADLRLIVTAGRAVQVKNIEFSGPALDAKQLADALPELSFRRILPKLPGLGNGWRLFPPYSPDLVEAAAAHLTSWYFSRGYLDAGVRADSEVDGTYAKVKFMVTPGPVYDLGEWTVSRTGPGQPVLYSGSKPELQRGLCPALFAERRAAERHGILDFSARLDVAEINLDTRAAPSATLAVYSGRGRPYRVSRIDLLGHPHFTDAFVRRVLLLDEGDPMDEFLLRKSIARLNRTGWFDPATESNVTIRTDEKSGDAQIVFQLRERQRNSWRLSGPVGPSSIGGALTASVESHIPAWGSGLFEMSTYAASLSLIAFAHPVLPVASALSKAPLFPVVTLSRPFIPGAGWESGFSVAPQLGWRFSALTYAATQLQQRLGPRILGDRGLIPSLPVTVERPSGEMTMICRPPQQRFTVLRTAAAFGLQFAGALIAF